MAVPLSDPLADPHSGPLDAAPVTPTRPSRRPVIAASIGNFIEWYDYAVYGTLTVVLATLFFPKQDPAAALLLAFTGYGVASIMRPAGAVFFGWLGDRYGRRVALSTVVLLMSVSTAMIGLLPTYDALGIGAPILLFALRALQGVSAGGEYGGSAAFLAEYAPPGRRGLYTSWQSFTTLASVLTGALIGAVLTRGLGQDVLYAWAWRIPFLVALPLGLTGLYLRLRLDDTPAFTALAQHDDVPASPLREVVRDHLPALARVWGIAIFGTVTTFVFLTYSATYLVATLRQSLGTALLGLSIGLVAGMVLCPFVGIAADRWGRRPVMLVAVVACLLLVYPGFLLLGTGSVAGVVGGMVLFCVLLALYVGAGVAVLTEAFPTRVRYSGLSLGYSIAGSLAGLLTPFAVTWLIGIVGVAAGPSLWIAVAGVFGLTAVLTMPETRDQPLG